jgi:hypothetical protein
MSYGSARAAKIVTVKPMGTLSMVCIGGEDVGYDWSGTGNIAIHCRRIIAQAIDDARKERTMKLPRYTPADIAARIAALPPRKPRSRGRVKGSTNRKKVVTNG